MNVRPRTSLVRARTSYSTRFDMSSCRKDQIASGIVEWFIYASFSLLSSRRLVKTYLPKKKEEDDYQ